MNKPMAVNQPGRFVLETNEYHIHNMYPPRPWTNYLWNQDLIAEINQFGFGRSFLLSHDDHRQGLNANERLMYVRDDATREFWAANRNYANAAFDDFHTVVGQGYSTIHSSYRKLKSQLTVFLPEDGRVECWEYVIENMDSQSRDVSLFAYCKPLANLSVHMAYNEGRFDEKENSLVFTHNGFDLAPNYTTFFFTSDTDIAGFEASDRNFSGTYGSLITPELLRIGADCANRGASFDNDMAGVLQFKVTLDPGQKRSVRLLLGMCSTESDIETYRSRLLAPMAFERERSVKRAAKRAMDKKLVIDVPDPELNAMTNTWLKHQIDLGKTFGRGAHGLRDLLQDTTAFVSLDPEAAKARILFCLGYQYPNGNTLRLCTASRTQHPYTDGATWIITAVCQYLKETGDLSLLEEVVGYVDTNDTGTIFDHCWRGLRYLFTTLGPHGLCQWGGGDWNDSLNNAGLQGKGESIWLTQASIAAGREFIRLLSHLGKHAQKAATLHSWIDSMTENLLAFGWEHDQFLCGYTDWDEKVGSRENDEGKIFLNMQSWGVLSGVLPQEQAVRLMDKVESELNSLYGYVLSTPSYTKPDAHIGRMTYFQKGAYENGAIYNHGVTFKIAADCMLGRGDHAYATIRKLLGGNPENPASVSGTEPYAVTNMYLGPDNPWRAGHSIFGWLTGTAGWLCRCITERVLGVQADYEGLTLNPCLPSHWDSVRVERDYRGCRYLITISNPNGLCNGQVAVTVDGCAIEGNRLPQGDAGTVFNVHVTISP